MSGEDEPPTKKDTIIDLILADSHDAAKAELALLDKGAIDDDGNTLYHEAVSRQDLKLLRWLLFNYQSSVLPYAPNKAGTTCFHIACAHGKTACFMSLWTQSKVQPHTWCKGTDSEGRNGLHMACLGGQQEVAREILSKLGDKAATTVNNNGQTALHMAAAGGHLSCVRLLVQYKKLINALDTYSATALHYAVSGGHMSTTKYLREGCKANTSGLTVNKMNLVHAAVSSGELAMVKYILSKTKESTHIMLTATGASVIHIATGMGYENILEFLLIQPYIYQLVNNAEENGWTAAHLAALRNRAGCLAILIGYGADIHNMRDKNRMSAYQVMCNNESADMRKTFPYLFDQLDSIRGHRRAYARHKYSRQPGSRQRGFHSSSATENASRNGSKNQNGAREQNAEREKSEHMSRKKESSKKKPSLSTSYIMETRMDFTKTNPLAQDATPGLQQRRFQKNNLALPNNGYVDRIASTSYQMGGEDDSDGDFQIDDIDLIPETPMKTIQKFNNFQHSTYTPTQSTEDLTKIGLTSFVAGSKTVQYEGATAIPAGSLPVIVDYSNQRDEDDDGIVIYFHNGALNTVKVKTAVEVNSQDVKSSPALNSDHISAGIEVHQKRAVDKASANSLIVNEAIDSLSLAVQPSERKLDSKQPATKLSSPEEPFPPPPPTLNLNDTPEFTRYAPDVEVPQTPLPPPTSNGIEALHEKPSLNRSQPAIKSFFYAGAEPDEPPVSLPASQQDKAQFTRYAPDVKVSQTPLPPPTSNGIEALHEKPSLNRSQPAIRSFFYAGAEPDEPPVSLPASQQNEAVRRTDDTMRQVEETVVRHSDSLEEEPVAAQPYKSDVIHAAASPVSLTYDERRNVKSINTVRKDVIRELDERNHLQSKDDEPAPTPVAPQLIHQKDEGGDKENNYRDSSIAPQTSAGASSAERDSQSYTNGDANIPDATSLVIPSSKNVPNSVAFTFQTIMENDSDAVSLKNSPKGNKETDNFKSADTIEREYLLFAEDELNNPTSTVSGLAGAEDERSADQTAYVTKEPDYAVIVKKKPDPSKVTSGVVKEAVRRLSSNASDLSDANPELKSSTSYKFNYRAYKKKISTKHDTATDLFEYNP